jgi:predicted nuclease with TOPRIM domain
MTDLVLEHLKQIQHRLGNIEGDVRDVKSELISIRTIMGELLKSEARQDGDYAMLKRRIERIEMRLELHDA